MDAKRNDKPETKSMTGQLLTEDFAQKLRGLPGVPAGGSLCLRCGSIKPAGQSCGCFDNGGQ